MKSLVLYSGGLDSRLAIKLEQEKGNEVTIFHIKLPFVAGKLDEKFLDKQNVNKVILDATKEPLFSEYLNVIKDPKFIRGKGFNPCMDCKVWIFNKSKQYADKNNISRIVSGEVKGQRPMSQTVSKLKIIDNEIKFKINRPLTELGIVGANRAKQIELANKFNITYPDPAGGCLLCEKILKDRIKYLIKNDILNTNNYDLINKGRHFIIKNTWFVVGRRELDNDFIETKINRLYSGIGFPAVYFDKDSDENKKIAKELQDAYSKKDETKIKEFVKYKL